MTPTPILKVENLQKTFTLAKGGTYTALENISFEVTDGEIVAVVGPSGAGKTTVLRCLAGLLSPTSGSVIFDGATIAETPKDVAAVFQDYSRSLLPWLSARSNVMLPLRSRGMTRAEARQKADAALASVGLEGREGAHPWQLSGGMQQRVALARALACNPRLLFMDEPFASLDAQTRMDLEDLVLHIHKEFGTTVLIVTHDIDEAIYLANHVVVLSKPPATVAQIVEIDLPAERHQTTTKENPEFAHLRNHVLNMVRRDPYEA